jgi:hypothetical protein
MNIKVFNIRLSKEHCQNDQAKMNEFLDKVSTLCFEYGYEIHPTIHGWTGETDENGKYKTIAIIGNDEIGEVIYIDGDGRGK